MIRIFYILSKRNNKSLHWAAFVPHVAPILEDSNLPYKQDPPGLTYRMWTLIWWTEFPYLFPFEGTLIKYACIDHLPCFMYWLRLKGRFRHELGFLKSWNPWNVSKQFTSESAGMLVKNSVTHLTSTKSDYSKICIGIHSLRDFSVQSARSYRESVPINSTSSLYS